MKRTLSKFCLTQHDGIGLCPLFFMFSTRGSSQHDALIKVSPYIPVLKGLSPLSVKQIFLFLEWSQKDNRWKEKKSHQKCIKSNNLAYNTFYKCVLIASPPLFPEIGQSG